MPRVLYRFTDLAGKSFRPSNGTEGEIFETAFCFCCELDREWMEDEKNPCSIHDAALFFESNDENYPKEWIFDQDGWPICTSFKQIL